MKSIEKEQIIEFLNGGVKKHLFDTCNYNKTICKYKSKVQKSWKITSTKNNVWWTSTLSLIGFKKEWFITKSWHSLEFFVAWRQEFENSLNLKWSLFVLEKYALSQLCVPILFFSNIVGFFCITSEIFRYSRVRHKFFPKF